MSYSMPIFRKIFTLSHFIERKEKNCLNCNAQVQGRFCHVCGQENIETKESVWQLVSHFVGDLFHFDGKFFSSLRLLMFKPGFLSREYLRGRRMSYINPIRMYIFSSAVFFLLFFMLMPANVNEDKNLVTEVKKEIEAEINSLQEKIKADTLTSQSKLDSIKLLQRDLEILNLDSNYVQILENRKTSFSISSDVDSFTSVEQYVRYQQSLPKKDRDGFFDSKMKQRQLYLNQKYKGDQRSFLKKLLDEVLHKIPIALFISLPFVAFLLNLVYFRNKSYYFADHAIFLLHLFNALFVFGLGIVLAGTLGNGKISSLISSILNIWMFLYWYWAFKGFYQQGWIKTILKGLFMFIMTVFIILMIIFFFGLFLTFTIA